MLTATRSAAEPSSSVPRGPLEEDLAEPEKRGEPSPLGDAPQRQGTTEVGQGVVVVAGRPGDPAAHLERRQQDGRVTGRLPLHVVEAGDGIRGVARRHGHRRLDPAQQPPWLHPRPAVCRGRPLEVGHGVVRDPEPRDASPQATGLGIRAHQLEPRGHLAFSGARRCGPRVVDGSPGVRVGSGALRDLEDRQLALAPGHDHHVPTAVGRAQRRLGERSLSVAVDLLGAEPVQQGDRRPLLGCVHREQCVTIPQPCADVLVDVGRQRRHGLLRGPGPLQHAGPPGEPGSG